MAGRRAKIRPVVWGLCLYFLLSATDSFQIGIFGSLLKIISLVPISLALLDNKLLRIRFHPVMMANLSLGLLALCSTFYSIDTQVTVTAVLSLLLNLAMIYLLGTAEAYSEDELRLLKRAMLWGGWISIILMMSFADRSASGRLTLRFGGATQDQNYINGYFLYAFSYHVGNTFARKGRKHLFSAVFMLIIVLMTGSRGALLAFMLTGFAHMCIAFRNSKHRLRGALWGLFLLVLLSIAMDIALSFMPESVAIRYSWDYIAEKGTTGRTDAWLHLLEHFSSDSILNMLFGHGYGTCRLLNTFNNNVAHNLYIDNLLTLGITGMLLQLTGQVLVFRTLLRRREYTLLGAYCGMIGMCMSLSLVSYKPLWNTVIMTLAIDISQKRGKLAL